MKRIPVIATVLTVTGGLLLAPAVAGADPDVSVTASGTEINGSVVAGMGTILTQDITGCFTIGGQPGYVGVFASFPDIEGAPMDHFEFLADENGGFHNESEIWQMEDPVRMEAHIYCGDAPITSMTDENLLWLSPTFDITIDPTQSGQGARQAKAASNGSSRMFSRSFNTTVANDELPVTVTLDQDALPLVDKMGITGDNAAELKAKVDKEAGVTTGVQRLIQRLLGKKASKPVSNEDYVKAAFEVLAKKNPKKAEVKAYTERLDAGELKVRIIEDIALTQHDAAWYNR